jgi:hypothetical protein
VLLAVALVAREGGLYAWNPDRQLDLRRLGGDDAGLKRIIFGLDKSKGDQVHRKTDF